MTYLTTPVIASFMSSVMPLEKHETKAARLAGKHLLQKGLCDAVQASDGALLRMNL